MTALETANKIKAKFGELISEPVEFRGEVTLKIADAEKIFEVCQFAKSIGLRITSWTFAAWTTTATTRGGRWFIICARVTGGEEIRLKTDVSEEKSELPSVVGVWRTANWHEREIYDLMGIRFHGHPDLRRILMWEGYPYYPLRKDFPLAGKPTDLPGVAFTRVTPMEGGPFVTLPGSDDAVAREPRVRVPENAEPGISDKRLVGGKLK